MFSSLIFIATMVVLGIPTALLFIPWCWITGDVPPLYKGTRFMLSSSCRLAGVRFHTKGLDTSPRPGLHLHVEPRLQSRPARAHLPRIPGRTSAFMKRSLMNLPVLGTGFRQGEFIAVDRTGNAADAQRA